MVTLDKIERMASFAVHLPPCNAENYQALADIFRTSLREWRRELQINVELVQSGAAAEYKRRAVEILSSDLERAAG